MNYETILLWVFVALFCLALLFEFQCENPTKTSIRQIAYDAVFLSLILIMGFVPQMGYITILPGLSLTLMHLPVLLGASLFGYKRGLLYGLFFGVTSWIQALSNPVGLNGFFVVPWVSVLPRLLFGFLCGFFFQLLRKNPKISRNPLVIGAMSFGLTLLHTVLVFGALFLFYFGDILPYFQSGDILTEGISLTFMGVILLGATLEAALAAILTPLLNKATSRLIERKGN